MVDPAKVSAIIVTRGDVDLQPILDTLIFDDVVVWDNSQKPEDAKVYGRTLAIRCAKHPVIYSQDDDLIHPPENQLRLCAEYRPGVLTGCMWEEWSSGAKLQGILGGYDDLVFAGSGAIYDRNLPAQAVRRYLAHYPLDDFFLLWADCIIGVLTPTRQIDMRFEILEQAFDDCRMANQPDAASHKREAIVRARQLRDVKQDAHAVYMDDLEARLQRHSLHL